MALYSAGLTFFLKSHFVNVVLYCFFLQELFQYAESRSIVNVIIRGFEKVFFLHGLHQIFQF